MLLEKELGLEIWPEFYFSTVRLYRLDYAIPVLEDGTIIKLGIEVNGGIWSKGNSGHSSGKGILRDYEKSNLAQSMGWKIITITPDQMMTTDTINLIKSMIKP